jgi:hypothetical protein
MNNGDRQYHHRQCELFSIQHGCLDQKAYKIPVMRIHNTQYTTQYTYPKHNTQYMIPNIQYPTHNTEYTVQNTQYPIHDTQYKINNTQHTVLNTQYTIHNTQYQKHNKR